MGFLEFHLAYRQARESQSLEGKFCAEFGAQRLSETFPLSSSSHSGSFRLWPPSPQLRNMAAVHRGHECEVLSGKSWGECRTYFQGSSFRRASSPACLRYPAVPSNGCFLFHVQHWKLFSAQALVWHQLVIFWWPWNVNSSEIFSATTCKCSLSLNLLCLLFSLCSNIYFVCLCLLPPWMNVLEEFYPWTSYSRSISSVNGKVRECVGNGNPPSILDWRIPWTEGFSDRLQSMGCRVENDWVTEQQQGNVTSWQEREGQQRSSLLGQKRDWWEQLLELPGRRL